jgi:hypothetical protein
MHAMDMQVWNIATVKVTLRHWQDVHAEFQEEDVLLYDMEVEDTASCVVCVNTWRSAQMTKMRKSPERKVLLQLLKCHTCNHH